MFYVTVLITTVGLVAILGVLMAGWLTHETKTEGTINGSVGIIINFKFTSFSNLPQHQTLPLSVEIENNRNDTIQITNSPIISLSENSSNAKMSVSSIISPHQKFTHVFDLNFDNVGFNSVKLDFISNATKGVLETSVATINVVSPDRFNAIEDQKLYYTFLWIVAIPAIIATIKNLKDLFGSK